MTLETQPPSQQSYKVNCWKIPALHTWGRSPPALYDPEENVSQPSGRCSAPGKQARALLLLNWEHFRTGPEKRLYNVSKTPQTLDRHLRWLRERWQPTPTCPRSSQWDFISLSSGSSKARRKGSEIWKLFFSLRNTLFEKRIELVPRTKAKNRFHPEPGRSIGKCL